MVQKHPLALCDRCPLASEPGFVSGYGPLNSKLVIVGEAPGAQEVRAGKPFIGPSGQLLDALLTAVGVSPNETYRTNVLLCRPPGNRPPSSHEVACCRPRLLAELKKHPGVVLTMGATAGQALGMEKGILAERGSWHVAVGGEGRDYLPTLHPAFVLRQPAAALDIVADIEKALLPKQAPVGTDWEPYVATMMADDTWPQGSQVVYDVETDAKGNLLSINLAWGPRLDQTKVLIGRALLDIKGSSIFMQEDVEYIGHNGKFDQRVLWRHGIPARLDFDTMLAHYALDERKGGGNVEGQFNRGVHGLKVLAGYYFDAKGYDDVVDKYAKARPRGSAGADLPAYDMSRVPLDVLARYGTLDAHYTWRLKQIFERRLKEQGVYQNLFKDLLMAASEAYAKVEHRGMAIDVDKLKALDRDWLAEKEDLHDDMAVMAGHDFNPRSTQQVAKLLYDELKLPTPPKRQQIGTSFKGGSERSTDKTAMIMIQDRHPIVPLLLKFRRLEKLHGSYVGSLREHLSADGRMRTTNKIHATEVGRIQSEDPSLHNSPRADDKEEGKYGKAIRDLFIASPGMLFGAGDLSQAELRVAAFLSRDPVLIQAFRDGGDPHGNVAKRVFGAGSGEEERYVAKAINFGVLYGGKKKTLIARVLDLRGFRPSMTANIAEVDSVVQNYMDTLKRLFEWREEQWQLVRKQGYVETLMGRRRRFLFISPENEDEVRKACVHAQVAGLASDINTKAFIQLTKEGVRTLLTVHDSILFECPADEMPDMAKHVKATMLAEWDKWITDVPGDVDIKAGESWGSLKKIKDEPVSSST